MARIVLIIWMFTSICQAGIVYSVENKNIEFITIPRERVLISKNCEQKGRLSCQAYTAFKRSSSILIGENDLFGGSNPGSLKCHKLGGVVFIARDAGFNENSVCQFSDESYIECGSLAD